MKSDIHPSYHPVVFVDTSTGHEFITRSTMKSGTIRKINGVEHYEIRTEITASSHPFWTGTQRVVDAEGRVEKFRKRYSKKEK